MAKSSGNKVSVEAWVLNKGTTKEKTVAKVAVRDQDGRFHGATNFRGSVIG